VQAVAGKNRPLRVAHCDHSVTGLAQQQRDRGTRIAEALDRDGRPVFADQLAAQCVDHIEPAIGGGGGTAPAAAHRQRLAGDHSGGAAAPDDRVLVHHPPMINALV
jgi:hypothetical protein